jgi:hypothetical protein
VLFAHESSILYIGLLEETGHLVSLASDGEVLFWDYTSEKIVKVWHRLCRKSNKKRKKLNVYAMSINQRCSMSEQRVLKY